MIEIVNEGLHMPLPEFHHPMLKWILHNGQVIDNFNIYRRHVH